MSPITVSLPTAAKIEGILELISGGKSLRQSCREFGMDPSDFRKRVVADADGLAQRYASARAMQMEALEDDIIQAADDAEEDHNRSRLKVDARKWIMARIAPKKYGDKVQNEVTGPNGGPVVYRWASEETNERRAP